MCRQHPANTKDMNMPAAKTQPEKHWKKHWQLLKMENSGLAFSSGVAATDAVIKLFAPGDEVIAANDMYGGTYRLFTKIFEKFGIKFTYIDTTDAANVESAIIRQQN